MRFLLDTCALSELNRQRPNPGVIEWFEQQAEELVFISIVTLAEIARGIEKARVLNPAHAARLDVWCAQVRHRFKGKIFEADEQLWGVWAALCGKADALGKPLRPIDALLRATAELYGLTIVTQNVTDFAPYPRLHNPWIELTA